MELTELEGAGGGVVENARSEPFLGAFSWGDSKPSFGFFGSFRAVSYEQNGRVVEGTMGRKKAVANDVRTAVGGGLVGGGAPQFRGGGDEGTEVRGGAEGGEGSTRSGGNMTVKSMGTMEEEDEVDQGTPAKIRMEEGGGGESCVES